ncbi:MAG: phosphoglucosamine mutase [Thermovirgaceae bacterium]
MIDEMKIRCLFGTDGVRDVANRGLMTPEMVLRLGRAFVLFLIERGYPKPQIAVGRDTRRSGIMLESALVSGLTSAGAEVVDLGVLPTPALSHAIKCKKCTGGAMVSASHNPPEYNGIKFLNAHGFKLRDEEEAEIEEYLGDSLNDEWRPTGAAIGTIRTDPGAWEDYAHWLAETIGDGLAKDLKVLVDCANGAATAAARMLFPELGYEADFIGSKPDGMNINERTGVMYLGNLAEGVKSGGYHLGIAFDGDADRTLCVDGKGRQIDGDILLWVIARWLKNRGLLGNGVVATVMSNLALEDHLKPLDIPVHRCPVGDRYVLDKMRETGARLGGEQSGHIILDEFVSTGDGLCTALAFLKARRELSEDIDSLVDRFNRYSQILKNVPVQQKEVVMEDPDLWSVIGEVERSLGDSGRVLVRPSGTEPMIRVLVETKDPAALERAAVCIVEAIVQAGHN